MQGCYLAHQGFGLGFNTETNLGFGFYAESKGFGQVYKTYDG